MRNLEQTIFIMEQALSRLREQQGEYKHSVAYGEFISDKQSDLTKFKNIVNIFNMNTLAINVASYLMDIKADKKFLKMTQDPEAYFEITPKLKFMMSVGY